MKQTYRYTNLKRFLGKVGHNFTLNDFISGSFYHINHGLVKFSFSPELHDEILNLFVSALGGRKQDLLFRVLKFRNIKSYGIYNRLWIELNKEKKIKSLYCAGQDETSELNLIRQTLYKEW